MPVLRHLPSKICCRSLTIDEAADLPELETKLASIMRAVGSAMNEPEDLLQLVLGMNGGLLFDQLFSGAAAVSGSTAMERSISKMKSLLLQR